MYCMSSHVIEYALGAYKDKLVSLKICHKLSFTNSQWELCALVFSPKRIMHSNAIGISLHLLPGINTKTHHIKIWITSLYTYFETKYISKTENRYTWYLVSNICPLNKINIFKTSFYLQLPYLLMAHTKCLNLLCKS